MSKSNSDKKSQLERFKEAARELGTDNDEERFNEKLGKLVKQKPGEKKAPVIQIARLLMVLAARDARPIT